MLENISLKPYLKCENLNLVILVLKIDYISDISDIT